MPITLPYHKKTLADKVVGSFMKFVNEPTSPTLLLNHLRKLTGKEAIITMARSDDVDPNTVNLNAYYDPEDDEENRKPFEITVVFNTDDKNVTMGKDLWRDFGFLVIDYLEHETIHQQQYRSRGYQYNRSYISKHPDPETKKKQEYLGNTDEIEAYAYNLSNELLRKTSGDYDQVLRLLRNFANTAMTKDQAGRLLSPNLYGYFKDFGFKTSHPVLKALMKKTYHHVMSKKRRSDRDERVSSRNSEIEQKTKDLKERLKALDSIKGSSYTAIVSN
jgi:hypothetical protein